jgi:EmrB/QacA subfamily drug resistance transporter
MLSGSRQRLDDQAGGATGAGAMPHRAEPTAPRRSSGLLVVLVLCVAEFMVLLDISATNVALASIGRDLGFSQADLQWVVTAYRLVFGGLLIFFGRVGDLWGRRRLLLLALATFSLASLSCGLSQAPGWLVGSRAVQGVGAAMLVPSALSLLSGGFPEGPARNRALGVWGAVAAVGAAAGLLLGGALVQVSWRGVFLCNVAIGLATLLTVRRLVGEQRGPAGGRLDVTGALTVTGGLAALVYGLSQVPAQGAGAPAVLASLALAGGLLAAFVVVEARAPAPLVPPSLLRVRGVAGANVVMLLGSAVVVAQAVFISLFLRQVLGYPPFVTGLALLPSALTVMVVSNLVPRQLPRFGARALLVVAGGLLAAGMALYARLPVDASYPQVLTGALPAAAGLGSAIVAVTIVATTGVRPEQQGITAGLLTTAQQVGGAIGVAILASIAAARTEQLALTQPPVAALHGGFQLAFTVASGLALASAAVAALVIPSRAGAEPAGRPTR